MELSSFMGPVEHHRTLALRSASPLSSFRIEELPGSRILSLLRLRSMLLHSRVALHSCQVSRPSTEATSIQGLTLCSSSKASRIIFAS
ncbi:hypothetical protein VTN00DRAFT_5081 [Thermoascus crustaceus]|uniref:uncharacterized protein n=1 Tax=Thermoascus crustaceus TaxID=5088 RepID=UPI003743BA08